MTEPSDPAIREQLYELIAPLDARDGGKLTPETRFVDDLGLDSVTIMELVAAVEDRFDITLPLNRLPEIRTIDDLAACVAAIRASGHA